MKKVIAVVIALIVVSGGIYGYLRYTVRETDFSSYKELKVSRGDIVEQVAATGVVKPSVGAEVTIGARMSGIVVKEPVRVGDRVKKGDLIAQIDDREALVSLKIARQKLAKIEERYPREIERLKNEVKIASLALKDARAALKGALADLETAKWFYDQKSRLYEHKSGPQSEMKRAYQEMALKEAAAKKAQNALRASELKLKSAKLALDNAKSDFIHDKKVAESEVKKAEIRLSYSVIEAPFDGIITYVSTQKGETVVAGLNAPKFVKILDPGKIENRVYIDETQIGRIRAGMRVKFEIDSYPHRKWEGRIAQIYPQPELQNNIVYYVAVVRGFADADLLRPEMTTHNRVIVNILHNVVRVPNRAVKFKDGRFFVYLKSGGKVKEQLVKTGVTDSRFTQITEGLAPGDTILAEAAKDAD